MNIWLFCTSYETCETTRLLFLCGLIIIAFPHQVNRLSEDHQCESLMILAHVGCFTNPVYTLAQAAPMSMYLWYNRRKLPTCT